MPGTTPTFQPITGTQLFALSTLGDVAVAGYWAGFYAPSQQGELSTAQAWDDPQGVYLFLKETPSDWEAFETTLVGLLPSLNPMGQLRCLWVANEGESSQFWSFTRLDARAAGEAGARSYTVLRASSFAAGNYTLSVFGQTALTQILDTDGGGLAFGGGHFQGPMGGYPVSGMALPFSGPQLGTLQGSISLAPSEPGGIDAWEALQVGLQYTLQPSAFDPKDQLPAEEVGLDNTPPIPPNGNEILHLPVFQGLTAPATLPLTFDPHNLLAAERTYVQLAHSGPGALSELDSHLRTTKGYPIKVLPLAAQGASEAVPAARLVFGAAPMSGADTSVARYHLCPDGAYQLSVQEPAAQHEVQHNLLLGLSGIEYITLSGANTDMMVFRGGQPAYIPAVSPGQANAPEVANALTATATTAHCTVMPLGGGGAGLSYAAQSMEAPLFAGLGILGGELLDFNPMAAFSLSSDLSAPPPVFPMGIFAGVRRAQIRLAQQVEEASLAPSRHYTLGLHQGVNAKRSVPLRRSRSVDDPLAVTPQGLIAELDASFQHYDGILLGNMPGTRYPEVVLSAVTGAFTHALQSNQLFFVAANVDVLMQGTSVRYQLTEDERPYLVAREVPDQAITNVLNAIGNSPQPFDTEDAYVTAMNGQYEYEGTSYLDSFLYVAGIMKVEMDGWTFQLSPRSWRTNPDSPTLMIAKFCGRTLKEMVLDTSSWGWPEVGAPDGGTLGTTQAAILRIFEAAAAKDATDELKDFYEQVVQDPNWNGFLFLNTPVDVSELPEDLNFLVAGVDLNEFYAHHIGFSQTPFEVVGGKPVPDQTAAFGLIYYNDPEDLYYDETVALGFKTTQVFARFANASLANFSAQVELMLNRLFGADLQKVEAERGNNLIINGSYQRVGGAPSYAFALTGQNHFSAFQTALSNLEVLSVHLVTGGDHQGDEVFTTFLLAGNLQFVDHSLFDMFSFGPHQEANGNVNEDSFLRFTGLMIDMSFHLARPTEQSFLALEGSASFNVENSVARTESLFNNFPLSLHRLIASPNETPEAAEPSGQTPEDMGYTSIAAPIDQQPMRPEWFGLEYTLDLGTLGALTGGDSLKLSVLVAWSRGFNNDNLPVYVGIKLPNIPVLGGSFPLQGVLRIGFRSFEFQTYRTETDQLGYLLKLRRFALSILVWSFPPGNNEITLFGAPGDPTASLGWYAAYDKDPKAASSGGAEEKRALLAETTEKATAWTRTERKRLSGRRKPPLNS